MSKRSRRKKAPAPALADYCRRCGDPLTDANQAQGNGGPFHAVCSKPEDPPAVDRARRRAEIAAKDPAWDRLRVLLPDPKTCAAYAALELYLHAAPPCPGGDAVRAGLIDAAARLAAVDPAPHAERLAAQTAVKHAISMSAANACLHIGLSAGVQALALADAEIDSPTAAMLWMAKLPEKEERMDWTYPWLALKHAREAAKHYVDGNLHRATRSSVVAALASYRIPLEAAGLVDLIYRCYQPLLAL